MPRKSPSPPLQPSTARAARKRRLSSIPTEQADQEALAAWLDMRHVAWFHVPNGGKRHVATAAALKRAGTRPGIPDIIILTPPTLLRPVNGVTHVLHGRRYIGCACELKRQSGGRLSDAQQAWMYVFEDAGWLHIVAKGFDDAVKQLLAAGY